MTSSLRVPTAYNLSEGATGSFFDEDIAIANPNSVEAPITVNIGQEDDARLGHAAVSTLVASDAPIIAERSMYWDSGGVLFKGGTNATAMRLP